MVVLVALLLSLTAVDVPDAAAAVPEIPVVTVVSHDSLPREGPADCPPSERGPPSFGYADSTTLNAVDHWLASDSARPQLPTPAWIRHCDTVPGAQFARAAAAAVTTPGQPQIVDPESGVFDRVGVAAKYGDELADACRTNSFTGRTLVLMADGTKKPIKDVKLGDWVMATDPETGEAGPREVVDLIRHGGWHTMVAVWLADGSTIEATDQHRFWVESRGKWVGAIALQAGDVVVGADGDRLTVESLGISEQDLTAYNLTVEGLHTYYVGAESVLVHNCIRNSHLAGSTHPKSGVPFDDAGFPNFSAWRHPDVSDVRIQLTGSRSKDFGLANEAAGLARTPVGYTWHHHQDAGLMQLIRADIHRMTGHTGGFSMR